MSTKINSYHAGIGKGGFPEEIESVAEQYNKLTGKWENVKRTKFTFFPPTGDVKKRYLVNVKDMNLTTWTMALGDKGSAVKVNKAFNEQLNKGVKGNDLYRALADALARGKNNKRTQKQDTAADRLAELWDHKNKKIEIDWNNSLKGPEEKKLKYESDGSDSRESFNFDKEDTPEPELSDCKSDDYNNNNNNKTDSDDSGGGFGRGRRNRRSRRTKEKSDTEMNDKSPENNNSTNNSNTGSGGTPHNAPLGNINNQVDNDTEMLESDTLVGSNSFYGDFRSQVEINSNGNDGDDEMTERQINSQKSRRLKSRGMGRILRSKRQQRGKRWKVNLPSPSLR